VDGLEGTGKRAGSLARKQKKKKKKKTLPRTNTEFHGNKQKRMQKN
jgi:hypothetical protein